MSRSPLDDPALTARIAGVLDRWPVAGLAVGVVRRGSGAWFRGRGVADVASGTPVNGGTVFRIGSITKTMTAIAVMQLWEAGLLDLDAPAQDHLRSVRLVPARGVRAPTLRHLLTHTAGVRAVRGASDLLRPDLGWSARAGRDPPPLARYYRRGLRVDAEPGATWAYSNHGFAVLGQVVEDVSGVPLDRYLRERVFDPLGMERSDLVRSDRVRPFLATGYALRADGLEAVPDRELITAGASAVCSSAGDMARYVAALLGGGANEHGAVLRPETLARMFAPAYRPDPRIPGMGLGFMRHEAAGHRLVGHDGIVRGFLSDMVLAPDDGIGVIALANTGGFDPRGAPAPVADAVLRRLMGLPDDAVRDDVPAHPEVWRDLCGRYSRGRGVLMEPQPAAALGAGVEVLVRRNRLTIRGRTPIPAVRRGLPLHPDDPDDPDAFRIDLSGLGAGTCRAVFGRGPDGAVTALHIDLVPMSFRRSSGARRARTRAAGALAAGAAALAVSRRFRRARPRRKAVRRA